MGRHEGTLRAVRAAAVAVLGAMLAQPCCGEGGFITTDVSGNGTFTFNNPGFLIIDPGNGGNFSGNIFGPGTVTKRGAGLSIFSGAFLSNYNGGTFVEGGTFRVDSPLGFPTGVGPVL